MPLIDTTGWNMDDIQEPKATPLFDLMGRCRACWMSFPVDPIEEYPDMASVIAARPPCWNCGEPGDIDIMPNRPPRRRHGRRS